MKVFILLFIVLSGCATYTESEELLLKQDADNKRLELIYLKEIQQAQLNNDQEAFDYFLTAYLEVPRLEIPEKLKEHPDYLVGGENVKY